MESDYIRVTFRLPPDLHRLASKMAERSERSLNWQLIHLVKAGAEKLERQDSREAKQKA
jgi:predicted HicB family RNase H-like nuclease